MSCESSMYCVCGWQKNAEWLHRQCHHSLDRRRAVLSGDMPRAIQRSLRTGRLDDVFGRTATMPIYVQLWLLRFFERHLRAVYRIPDLHDRVRYVPRGMQPHHWRCWRLLSVLVQRHASSSSIRVRLEKPWQNSEHTRCVSVAMQRWILDEHQHLHMHAMQSAHYTLHRRAVPAV